MFSFEHIDAVKTKKTLYYGFNIFEQVAWFEFTVDSQHVFVPNETQRIKN